MTQQVQILTGMAASHSRQSTHPISPPFQLPDNLPARQVLVWGLGFLSSRYLTKMNFLTAGFGLAQPPATIGTWEVNQ